MPEGDHDTLLRTAWCKLLFDKEKSHPGAELKTNMLGSSVEDLKRLTFILFFVVITGNHIQKIQKLNRSDTPLTSSPPTTPRCVSM